MIQIIAPSPTPLIEYVMYIIGLPIWGNMASLRFLGEEKGCFLCMAVLDQEIFFRHIIFNIYVSVLSSFHYKEEKKKTNTSLERWM